AQVPPVFKPQASQPFSNVCQRTNLIEADRRLSPLTRGKGWFRDVRLRRSGEAYMRSSKLYQKATSRQAAGTGNGFEKPTLHELAAYEEELQAHLEGLRKKLGSVPMNERREISLRSAGPGQVIGARLKGLKKRATELEKKPRSVIKGTLRSSLLAWL
ncbi:unnamed protein product, partial [Symbiodinium pilosum]